MFVQLWLYSVHAEKTHKHLKQLFTPQLVGKPASWGVLRLFWITCVFYILYMYVCAHHNA